MTGLLYAMSRRLFNERVGTVRGGHLRGGRAQPCSSATWPPTTPPRCSCSPWRPGVVRADRGVPLAGLPARRAGRRAGGRRPSTRRCCSCRASSAWPGWRPCRKPAAEALIRSVALGVATAGLLAGALYLAGPDYLTGIKFTTLDRFEGTLGRLAALGLRAVDRRAVRAGRRRGGIRMAAVHRAGRAKSRPAAAGLRRALLGAGAWRAARCSPRPSRSGSTPRVAVEARRASG